MDINSIKYCKRCGRVFNFKISPMCPECIKQTDKDYNTIRDYIEKNKFVTISDISENTEVDEKIILFLLKEGRLHLQTESGQLVCEKCGKSIASGHYCDPCFKKLRGDLEYIKTEMSNDALKQKRETNAQMGSNDRMHTAERFIEYKE